MKFIYLAGALLASAALIGLAFTSAGQKEPHEAAPSVVGAPGSAKPVSAEPTSLTGREDHVPDAPPAKIKQDAANLPPASAPKQVVLEHIQEAAVSYDPVDLPKIQPYLTHPDVEVREAAVQGIVTLGHASGAPLLRAAAKQLTDPAEAVAMLQAADYVELPSGSMLPMRKKKDASEAK